MLSGWCENCVQAILPTPSGQESFLRGLLSVKRSWLNQPKADLFFRQWRIESLNNTQHFDPWILSLGFCPGKLTCIQESFTPRKIHCGIKPRKNGNQPSAYNGEWVRQPSSTHLIGRILSRHVVPSEGESDTSFFREVVPGTGKNEGRCVIALVTAVGNWVSDYLGTFQRPNSMCLIVSPRHGRKDYLFIKKCPNEYWLTCPDLHTCWKWLIRLLW